MSNITVQEKNMAAVESALVMNDISKLNTQERMAYYDAICESVGLNPLTKPFAFLSLQGKTVLYATKDCTEQLRKINGVSTQIVSKGVEDGMYVVHIKARDKNGREDEDVSAIPIGNNHGNDFANIMMKAITKAKRRVTLSICGLGILDESELDTIPKEVKGFTENPQIINPLVQIRTDIENKRLELEQKTESENDLAEYVCKVGKKYSGKKLSEIDMFELDNYIQWIKESADKKGKILEGEWLEFYEKAEAYLYILENKKDEIPF